MAVLSAGKPRQFRAALPPPWSAETQTRWRDYTRRLAGRSDTAGNVADYGEALLRRYEVCGPPKSAADLDQHAERKLATGLLGRSHWDPELASMRCASDAMSHGPEMLLAGAYRADWSRAESFQIYATSALYPCGRAVPLRWQRSFDEHDQRADHAIGQLLSMTARLARTSRCSAPLVSLDLGLSDHLVLRLAGDDRPFVAALGPDWAHMDVHPLDVPPMLSGHSPLELFMQGGDHIQLRDAEHGPPIQLVRAGYRGRMDSGLFYVFVPGAPTPFMLVRPPALHGAPSRLAAATAAARVAASAAELHGQLPLDPLGVEKFHASAKEDIRWYRHTTSLQAVLTFTLVDQAANDME